MNDGSYRGFLEQLAPPFPYFVPIGPQEHPIAYLIDIYTLRAPRVSFILP